MSIVAEVAQRMADAQAAGDDAFKRFMYPECFPPLADGKTYLELLSDLVPVRGVEPVAWRRT